MLNNVIIPTAFSEQNEKSLVNDLNFELELMD